MIHNYKLRGELKGVYMMKNSCQVGIRPYTFFVLLYPGTTKLTFPHLFFSINCTTIVSY